MLNSNKKFEVITSDIYDDVAMSNWIEHNFMHPCFQIQIKIRLK